MYALKSVVLG